MSWHSDFAQVSFLRVHFETKKTWNIELKEKEIKSGFNENIERFNENVLKKAEHVFVYTCNLEHSENF